VITPRVGFIGLGNIGEAMAGHLARSGVDLTVYDTRHEPCDRLAAFGASVAANVAEVAAAVDTVHLAVVDDTQVMSVITGEGGVLSADRLPAVVVVHSTVSPATCRALRDVLLERAIGFVDAALTGTVDGDRVVPAHEAAASGELTLLVGGADADVARCRPVLEQLAGSIVHVGDVGTGQFAKIVNNHLAQLGLSIVREAVELAAAGGIPMDRLVPMLRGSSGNSWALQAFPALHELATTSYTTGAIGFGTVFRKDLSLAVAAANELGVKAPWAALGAQLAVDLFRPLDARAGIPDGSLALE
jgi:3-hydroxyisobutyrate dehydrogenase-like beta-hydroxyacid dehydrogenase